MHPNSAPAARPEPSPSAQEPVPLEGLLLPSLPAGAPDDPVPLESLLLPSEPSPVDDRAPQHAMPWAQRPSRVAEQATAARATPPAGPLARLERRHWIAAAACAAFALAGAGLLLARSGRGAVAAVAPDVAQAKAAPAPAAPLATKPSPQPAAVVDRLHGGRSAAWWRERLEHLSHRTDAEGQALYDATLRRAVRLGITGIPAQPGLAASAAGAP